MRRWVRRPLVQLDARGRVGVHGIQLPVRLVMHTTESKDYAGVKDLQGVVNWWVNAGDGLGAHIIVDAVGNSALCGNPDQIMWAVAARNTGTVHIELIARASFLPKRWWARILQLNKAAKWAAWLNLEYGIPLRFDINYGISGHKNQPNQTHTDPGLWFPMKYFIRKARKYRERGWT